MIFFRSLIDLFLHLDKHLAAVISQYGMWTYGLLFLIIFCETGLVITPFLPGDSLLFAAGAFAAIGSLNVIWLFLLLFAAAVLGDTINYGIGRFLGKKIVSQTRIRLFNQQHLDRTKKFFDTHGGKSIIFARFVPIVRTFIPFVAGVGSMRYKHFFAYNVIGGLAWVGLFTFGGYFFGNLDIVKRNFSLVVILIILLSLLPMVVDYIAHRAEKVPAKPS